MEIKVAKSAGFCFGVKRAVDMVYDRISENGGSGEGIYTLGPIIHNEVVVSELAEKGVKILEKKSDGFYVSSGHEYDTQVRKITEEELKDAIVIVRSHGVEKQVFSELQKTGATIADATCPFVKKIHTIVEQESKNGADIVIIGDPQHPEVQGICSYCEKQPLVIDTPDQAKSAVFAPDQKVCVVSQTTANYNKFEELVEILSKKAYSMNSVNTICNATATRQQEARSIAKQVELMIVIGGTHSSNSQKLYEICKKECENTYFIQTPGDLHLDYPKSVRSVGITAGASTPNNIIEEVQDHVRTIF
ncbi:MAG: 4-hydroxy-3-methylbut-2-enyl diphosphate reductase [Lachnospiraceae bacterium]|nr:4-hydroxy-3-methylbut-2-enyl diphosphate reductase [Lachnospiraceae bacterium]